MNLLEDVIVESIQVMGHNCYYLPRESYDDGDMILGEYSKSFFKKAYMIETYISSANQFEGQGDFFSKFGLEIRDVASFVLSKRAFNKFVPSTLRLRPQEGDLLYVPVFHRMFEVKFVEEEKTPFFALGKTNPYCYELRCELFRYSQEPIETGVEDVDDVSADNSYTIKLNLLANGTGAFAENDVVYQGTLHDWRYSTASGTISSWDYANSALYLYDIRGNFTSGQNVYSNTTNAIWIMSGKDDVTDFISYDIYDNKDVDTGADLIVDLTESNIFGTP